jgi:hypothetical protein
VSSNQQHTSELLFSWQGDGLTFAADSGDQRLEARQRRVRIPDLKLVPILELHEVVLAKFPQ